MTSERDQGRKATLPRIVAVTASAANTRSLEMLLSRLDPQPDVALIVVLERREALAEDRFWQAAADGGHEQGKLSDVGALIQPGRLYLPAADLIATIDGGRLLMRPAEQEPGARGVIDSFLVSLAKQAGEHSIVVALAGTDDDGTLGVREMKDAGGLVLAEETEESKAGDLARSDAPAALADAVLPIEDLVSRLEELLDQADDTTRAAPLAAKSSDTTEALASVASILRNKTGHDFHGYKSATFLRRVQRRMQVLQVTEMQDYIEALRTKKEEAQDLFNDLLIGVTEFFRDKREWELLEQEVIPKLFEGKGPRDQLRIWVVGCSTGEEAYSIAILLREHMARIEDAPQIQIFASDLDGRALAAARAGRYPDTIAPQMTPERLGRWFVKEGNTYHIAKELREMCIFSQHSIIKDAPFSRIDLISCRNLLIYLDADLQTQVIPLFHFALRSGGVLFLGNSENVSRHAALFSAVESRSRIFSRIETATRALPSFPFTSVDRRLLSQPVFVPATESPRADSGDLARKAQQVAERYAPAYAVLDHAYTVLQFSGRTGRFLDPAGGVASLNFLQLVHSSLRLDLRAALARATEEDRSVTLNGLSVESGGHQLSVDIVVEPIRESSSTALGFMVLFRDSAVRPDSETPQKSRLHESEHTQRLEDELQLTKARLQGTIEELESTNEELKSSNEEYQSLNEELQSANEELETSKEELQSINEELTTVNGELAHRVQELGRANSDLKNFLESTQIATLFLDNDLRVTNFTPTIVEVFHLIESDLGRPIGHLRPRVAYDELQDDVRRVLRTLQPVEREIDNPATGARHMVRVLPYRSTDNFIAGVVITFVDMTARRQAEERLRESEERFRAIVETARDYAIFTTDPEGRIMIWPAGASQIFGWTAAEAIGRSVDITFTPEDRANGVPGKEREEARDKGHAPDVRWHVRKDGSHVFIDGVSRPLTGPDGAVTGFVKVGQDVTERRATQEALRESEERFRQFGDASADVLWIRDAETLEFEYINPAFAEIYGMRREDLQTGNHVRRWVEAVHRDDRGISLDHLRRVRAGESLVNAFRILRRSDGEIRWIRDTGFPLLDADGRVQRLAGIGHDATEEVELNDRLRVLVAELQHRTRNLLAVVSAVARKTRAGSTSLDDFGARFETRLGALARVNSLLSRLENGHRIAFDELLQAELSAHGVIDADGHGSRVSLDGPKGVPLRSASVQTLALALHELTTNALKYGALSHAQGRLDVRWRLVSQDDHETRMRLTWEETGLAARAETDDRPVRRGYGRHLIEQALVHQLGAETHYELSSEGVRCIVDLPLSSTMEEARKDIEEPDA